MPVFKKDARTSKNNYRPVGILFVFPKIFKGYLVDNVQSSLIMYYLNFNVVLERVMELNIASY